MLPLMFHKTDTLKDVAAKFDAAGELISGAPYGSGHINDTYLVELHTRSERTSYILQRINHNVFKDPPGLMENILRVTSHIRRKLAAIPGSDPDRESLTVIPARDGLPFYRDTGGNYWRMYYFIRNARTYDICENADHAREAAFAIGRFQCALADIPGGPMHETIPFFHHTPRRFQALEEAIGNDARGRKEIADKAISFCMARRDLTTALTCLVEGCAVPERIAHNDAKFNNVMLDDRTGRAVCVIDLDTVMSGCALYDFGDMVRTIARTGDEDERDLAKVEMQLPIFEKLVEGYLAGASAFLTPAEIENLPLSGKVITFTIGIRFLTDFLAGDVYFKTHRPGHNLERAMVQFKMLESMERQEQAMRDIVRQHCG